MWTQEQIRARKFLCTKERTKNADGEEKNSEPIIEEKVVENLPVEKSADEKAKEQSRAT